MDGNSCVKSTNYPSNYGNSQACTVEISPAAKIDVIAFNTESGYDEMTVNGVEYSGDGSGLDGKVSTLSWSTDEADTRSGWKVCFNSELFETVSSHNKSSFLFLARSFSPWSF
jgi:hypothetical protein